jgi:hypothetical protein
LNATLSPRLYDINKELRNPNIYVPIDINSLMSGYIGWQRCACCLLDRCMILLIFFPTGVYIHVMLSLIINAV